MTALACIVLSLGSLTAICYRCRKRTTQDRVQLGGSIKARCRRCGVVREIKQRGD